MGGAIESQEPIALKLTKPHLQNTYRTTSIDVGSTGVDGDVGRNAPSTAYGINSALNAS
jgi:hypothetical protein